METSIHKAAAAQAQPEKPRHWWSGLLDLLRGKP